MAAESRSTRVGRVTAARRVEGEPRYVREGRPPPRRVQTCPRRRTGKALGGQDEDPRRRPAAARPGHEGRGSPRDARPGPPIPAAEEHEGRGARTSRGLRSAQGATSVARPAAGAATSRSRRRSGAAPRGGREDGPPGEHHVLRGGRSMPAPGYWPQPDGASDTSSPSSVPRSFDAPREGQHSRPRAARHSVQGPAGAAHETPPCRRPPGCRPRRGGGRIEGHPSRRSG